MQELVVFIALVCGGIVHTTAGFGSALIAMPILTLALAPTVATPLQNAVGLFLCALIWYQHRERWPWRESIFLIAFSLLGIPLGTYALLHLPERWILGILGVVLLVFPAYEIVTHARGGKERTAMCDPAYIGASFAGLLAGILGAAYATNGPPAIIYGSLRRWPRAEFKSVLQSLFLINGIAIVGWEASQGLFTRDVGWYAVFAFPGLALGAAIGHRIDKRLDHNQFQTVVLVLIAVLGVVMLARALS